MCEYCQQRHLSEVIILVIKLWGCGHVYLLFFFITVLCSCAISVIQQIRFKGVTTSFGMLEVFETLNHPASVIINKSFI